MTAPDPLHWEDVAALVTDADALEREMLAICGALSRARFRYANEIDLHEGLTAMLNAIGIQVGPAQREVRLSARDRIDFLLRSGIGIEVKVDGRAGDVWRQIRRYTEHDRVRALLLITTRARHVAGSPDRLNGKMITVYVLRGGLR